MDQRDGLQQALALVCGQRIEHAAVGNDRVQQRQGGLQAIAGDGGVCVG